MLIIMINDCAGRADCADSSDSSECSECSECSDYADGIKESDDLVLESTESNHSRLIVTIGTPPDFLSFYSF